MDIPLKENYTVKILFLLLLCWRFSQPGFFSVNVLHNQNGSLLDVICAQIEVKSCPFLGFLAEVKNNTLCGDHFLAFIRLSLSLSLSLMQRQQLNLLPMMLGSRPDPIY